jgi:hypothetical protein
VSGDCINCGGDAEREYEVRIEGEETIEASLCQECATALDAESFISVARRVSQ